MEESASRTSIPANGLIIAVTSFIEPSVRVGNGTAAAHGLFRMDIAKDVPKLASEGKARLAARLLYCDAPQNRKQEEKRTMTVHDGRVLLCGAKPYAAGPDSSLYAGG